MLFTMRHKTERDTTSLYLFRGNACILFSLLVFLFFNWKLWREPDFLKGCLCTPVCLLSLCTLILHKQQYSYYRVRVKKNSLQNISYLKKLMPLEFVLPLGVRPRALVSKIFSAVGRVGSDLRTEVGGLTHSGQERSPGAAPSPSLAQAGVLSFPEWMELLGDASPGLGGSCLILTLRAPSSTGDTSDGWKPNKR